MGIGILGCIESLICFVFVKSIPGFFVTIGIHGLFLMCAISVMSLLVFSYFLMPETSGLALEEIEDIYRSKE